MIVIWIAPLISHKLIPKKTYIIRCNRKANKDRKLLLVQNVVHPHRKTLVAKQPRFFCKCQKIYRDYITISDPNLSTRKRLRLVVDGCKSDI